MNRLKMEGTRVSLFEYGGGIYTNGDTGEHYEGGKAQVQVTKGETYTGSRATRGQATSTKEGSSRREEEYG